MTEVTRLGFTALITLLLPDLKFNFFTIQLDGSDFEIDAYSIWNFFYQPFAVIFKYQRSDSPIVDMNELLNESSLNLNNRQVLPTPLSPINNSLNK